MTREDILSSRWNNRLSLGLGLVVLVYAFVTLAAGAWSDRDGFIGMAVLGALY